MGKHLSKKALGCPVPEKLPVSSRLGFLKVKKEAESLAVLSTSLWLMEGTKMLLSFSQRDEAKAPLTFFPVAENIPGFAQVDSSAVVHDADVSRAAVWGGEGGRVAHPPTIQPASRAQVVPCLQSAQPEGKTQGKSRVVGLGNCTWNEQSPQGTQAAPALPALVRPHILLKVSQCLSSFQSWKEPEGDSQSDSLS